MNPKLQHKFEMQLLDHGITKDRRIFNKDNIGGYINQEVLWMYRVWIMQEANIERLTNMYKSKVEESFILGYYEAQHDFKTKGEVK